MAQITKNNFADSLFNAIQVRADIIAEERSALINSVMVNADRSRVAETNKVISYVTPDAEIIDLQGPSVTPPQATTQDLDKKELEIDQFKTTMFRWSGEEAALVNQGNSYQDIRNDQMTQAMRGLRNHIERYINNELTKQAGYTVGTRGTTPFGANINVLADAMKILDDNGVPQDQATQTLVLNTTASTNMYKLNLLQQVNTSGDQALLRGGVLGDLFGYPVRKSAGPVTTGTITGYLVNGGNNNRGSTTLRVDTGTANIPAGVLLTIAGDSTIYRVSGPATSNGTATLNIFPALQQNASNNAAVTITGRTPNWLIHRPAAELAIRAPYVPPTGDGSQISMAVQDSLTGIVYDVRVFGGWFQTQVHISVAFGFKVWKPEFVVEVTG